RPGRWRPARPVRRQWRRRPGLRRRRWWLRCGWAASEGLLAGPVAIGTERGSVAPVAAPCTGFPNVTPCHRSVAFRRTVDGNSANARWPIGRLADLRRPASPASQAAPTVSPTDQPCRTDEVLDRARRGSAG